MRKKKNCVFFFRGTSLPPNCIAGNSYDTNLQNTGLIDGYTSIAKKNYNDHPRYNSIWDTLYIMR